MFKKSNIFILSLFFLLSLFVFYASSIADARAGGGHRFSGGSRSSSRSFRSSSHSSYSSSFRSGSHRHRHSDADLSFLLDIYKSIPSWLIPILIICHILFSYLAVKGYNEGEDNWFAFLELVFISSPFMFITGVLGLVFALIYFSSNRNNNDTQTNSYSFKETQDYSELKTKDSTFNKEEFLIRAKKAFNIIQESWSNRDLSKAEAFLADGTYEQFQIQINAMKANHEIDLMKDIIIKKASVVRLSSKSGYDQLNVLFNVRAVNYRIDDRDNSFRNGSKSPEEFSEIWTFMRRTGSKTIKKGLIEGYCPNCGAQVQGARLSKCPSCSCLLRSGQHDWILAGITQASEWRDAVYRNPTAYNQMLHNDRNINIPHLEDKLTVMFWRMVEANRIDSVEPIKKISTNEFAQSYVESNYSDAFPKCKECALGSQEVIGFITNRPDYDYLIGQLVWSGISISDNKELLRRSMFVLRRGKGAQSELDKCFCSTHCPNCGANEPSDLSSNYCEYCNSAFNNDKKDWMLCDLLKDFNNPLAQKYIIDANRSSKGQEATLPSVEQSSNIQKSDNIDYNAFDYFSGTDLLSLTVAMMLADGVIDNREMNIINKIRNARNINYSELSKIISRLRNTPDPIQFVLDTTAIKLDENLLKLLISIAAADNRIEDSELRVLQKVSQKMEISEKRLRELINEIYEKNWNK